MRTNPSAWSVRRSLCPFVPSAPRHFPWPGLIWLSLYRVLLLGVISQTSLQPLPGLRSFRKPENSGSEGDPDSATKSPAFRRMFEKRLCGARASRRPRRSVCPRGTACGPHALGGRPREARLGCRPLWLGVFWEVARLSRGFRKGRKQPRLLVFL